MSFTVSTEERSGRRRPQDHGTANTWRLGRRLRGEPPKRVIRASVWYADTDDPCSAELFGYDLDCDNGVEYYDGFGILRDGEERLSEQDIAALMQPGEVPTCISFDRFGQHADPVLDFLDEVELAGDRDMAWAGFHIVTPYVPAALRGQVR